jgi:rSAM/selenodomain-associated transferase 2
MATAPELSIVIPVLNEADTIALLWARLARQRGVAVELVFCDGGSVDSTTDELALMAENSNVPVRLIRTGKGRARQLNAGAAASCADTILFLHADSAFPDELALRTGLDRLNEAIAAGDTQRIAGRFGLAFDRGQAGPAFGYYYYECKARLNRCECIHGDQGMLLRRAYFEAIGGFDETLPLAEDNRFADLVLCNGSWLLLPATIITSPRRFETEGLVERQTLNAMLMNLLALGRHDFLRALPQAYRIHSDSRRLDLYPVFATIGQLVVRLPQNERRTFWHDTGRYVAANAWQLAFLADIRRNFRRRLPAGSGPTPFLEFYDRHLHRLAVSTPAAFTAAILTRAWFLLNRFRLRRMRQANAPS